MTTLRAIERRDMAVTTRRVDLANPTSVDELIVALQSMRDAEPLDRARLARKLGPAALRLIGAAGDEAVYSATLERVRAETAGWRLRTRAEVADALGVSLNRVNHAIQDYRNSIRPQ